MPVGLIVMKWDDRVGTELIAKYPEEINVADKTLMQIYSSHEYSGEPGMISLLVGSLNIASYYAGPETRYYIILLLNLDDDADAYEGGLSDISRIILENLEDNAFVPLISSLFQRISVYPSLNQEQMLAITYQDHIKRMIIERLRDEGVVSKSELVIWLRDHHKSGFVDIESLIVELIKIDIIKESSVKGMPSELLFLINDILLLRRPPIELLKDPADKGLPTNLVDDYRKAVRSFFRTYEISDEDNLKLIELLIDPQIYETLRLLRTTIVTKNILQKLKKKGVEDIDAVLKTLWESQLIQVFQGPKGIEYYGLLSDFYVNTFFPKYIMDIIIKEYEVKSKADKVLVEYLNVLEDAYFSYKESKKAHKKEAAEERSLAI